MWGVEDEGCCKSILGQGFTKLLGQAMTQSRQVVANGRWIDQESFVISIHGTRLRMTADRTRALDLRRAEDRIEALRWLWDCCDTST